MTQLKCPICKKPVALSDPDAPFCSERCRVLDLDNWATGRYVISTPAPHLTRPDDSEDDAES
jgi:endogenous inhibitor of DNA gyrase (YacG/DUF329 family)